MLHTEIYNLEKMLYFIEEHIYSPYQKFKTSKVFNIKAVSRRAEVCLAHRFNTRRRKPKPVTLFSLVRERQRKKNSRASYFP